MREAWLLLGAALALGAQPREISGVYPHLAMFNGGDECGTGAVVPWAGKLWAVTYSPHSPFGSGDRLYEISPDLTQRIRPESIGGTPANRMIHRESQQLFIGPYAIDAQGRVRAIPYEQAPGYGQPGYAQLGRSCPAGIAEGAEDGAAMGMTCHLKEPQRLGNLWRRLDEYLPLGLEPGVVFVT